MRRVENHCRHCAVPAYPCLGNACEYRRVVVFYCDECKQEIDGDLYDDEMQELCADCLLDKYRKEKDLEP